MIEIEEGVKIDLEVEIRRKVGEKIETNVLRKVIEVEENAHIIETKQEKKELKDVGLQIIENQTEKYKRKRNMLRNMMTNILTKIRNNQNIRVWKEKIIIKGNKISKKIFLNMIKDKSHLSLDKQMKMKMKKKNFLNQNKVLSI